MNEYKNKITLDLCDQSVKHLFSEFIQLKMRSNKISRKQLDEQLCLISDDPTKSKDKTIQRYLAGINQMPDCIPQDTYISFLHALSASDEEFRSFVIDKQQATSASSKNFWIGMLTLIRAPDYQPSESSQGMMRGWVQLLLWGIPLILLISYVFWKSPTSYYELGVMAREQKQYAKAIDFFRKAIEKNNKHAEAYYDLADVYADQTNQQKAIDYYYQGLAVDSRFDSRANNNLALLLLAQNDIGNTLVLLDKAWQSIDSPIEEERWAQTGIILKNRAWAYWKKGNYAKAMEHIIQAQQQLGPAHMLDQFPEVFCLHAAIARQLDDTDLAEKECIKRFETYQVKQKTGAIGTNIRPIHGMIYDLYELVQNQRNNL